MAEAANRRGQAIRLSHVLRHPGCDICHNSVCGNIPSLRFKRLL